jgi:hypothetical protein
MSTPDLLLLLHDIGDGLSHDRVIGCAVEALPLVLSKQLIDDGLRAGQAANVGGEYTVATELHSALRADGATHAFTGHEQLTDQRLAPPFPPPPGCPVDRLLNMPQIAENVSLATSFAQATTLNTTTLPHLFVVVPKPARRPVKGELCSAAKRRWAVSSAGYPRFSQEIKRTVPRAAAR